MHSHSLEKKIIILSVIWLMPVVLFILDPLKGSSSLALWFATLASLLVSFKDKRYFVFFLPFVAVLSPLVQEVKIINLYPSDFFILILGVFLIWKIVMKRQRVIRLHYGDVILITLMLVVFISYIFSFEHQLLLKSIANWFLIIISFLSCRMYLSNKDLKLYFLTLTISILLSSLLIIFSYFDNITLNNLIYLNQVGVSLYTEDLSRASYFYTNIGFLIAVVILFLYTRLFDNSHKINKIVTILFMVILILSLVVMLEKTALFALLLTVILSTTLFFYKLRIRIRIVFISVVLLCTIVGIYLFQLSYVQNIDLFNGFHVSGFKQRLCVFSSTMDVLFDNVGRFIFVGFGPDSSILLTGNENIDASKVSCGGESEGAIDSTYITFLFEYGLIFTLLFLIYLIKIIEKIFFRILQSKKPFNGFLVYYFMIMIYFSISFISDTVGTSKIMWIVAQLFALSPIILTNNKNIESK
jgi:hypothetical protein